MKSIPAFVLGALLVSVWTALAAPPAGYYLQWSDEFSGTDLDANNWNITTGTRNDAINSADAVGVTNGSLAITTYTSNGVHYTGFIDSNNKFETTYGYFEARIAFQESSGNWSAFWLQSDLMGTPGDPAVQGVEMDIAEHRSKDSGGANIANKVIHALHWNGYGVGAQSTAVLTPNLGLASGYHLYSLEWTSNAYNFYVDGSLTWTTNAAISMRDQFIRLTSEVRSNDWAGAGVASYGSLATSTNKMLVDYVRVYAPAGVPMITTQPQAQQVYIGLPATLSVAANNPLPLSYQWRKNGTNILGATNSLLTFANVQLTNGGTYTVLVDNGATNVLSDAAVLTVLPAPLRIVDSFDIGALPTVADDFDDARDVAWQQVNTSATASLADDTGGLNSGNALDLAVTGAATFQGFLANYARRSLANVGEKLVLAFDFRYTTAPNASGLTSQGLRWGLFDSTTNNATGTNGVGYSAAISVGSGGAGSGSLFINENTGFGYAASATAGLGSMAVTPITTPAGHHLELTLTRTTAGVDITASVDGSVSLTRTDASGLVTEFDSIVIRNGSAFGGFRVDNVRLEFVPLPAPNIVDTFDVQPASTSGNDDNDPLDAAWSLFTVGTSRLDTVDDSSALVTGNALDVAVNGTTTFQGVKASFTRRVLANTGDQIALSFDARYTNQPTVAVGSGFRWGLFDSTTNNNLGTNGVGYFGQIVVGPGITGSLFSTKNSGVGFGAGTSVTLGNVTAANFQTASRHFELLVTRNAAGGSDTLVKLDGTTISRTDNAATNLLAFDTIVIRNGGVTNSFRLDNVALNIVSPSLAVTQSVGQVEVSWPASALGFTLQSTASLSPPVAWSNVAGSTATNRISFPAANSAKFYRLSQ